jgi:hypothetical protein
MTKKLFVTLALMAKAMTLAAAVMVYAGSSAPADSEDCWPCIPPPSCMPDCSGGES